MLTGIDRVPTEAERNEMEIVGEKTPGKMFSKLLAEVAMKFAKKHEPFDEQCARLDYEDEIEKAGRESERVHGFVRVEDMMKIELDLEKYGNEDRFVQEDDDEEIEFMNVNGIRTATKVGHTIKYRCKPRGHGCSVFLSNDVYMRRYPEKFSEKELLKEVTEEEIRDFKKKRKEKKEIFNKS